MMKIQIYKLISGKFRSTYDYNKIFHFNISYNTHLNILKFYNIWELQEGRDEKVDV